VQPDTIGNGDGIGPDLVNVADRRDLRWVARYIEAGPVLAEAIRRRLSSSPGTGM